MPRFKLFRCCLLGAICVLGASVLAQDEGGDVGSSGVALPVPAVKLVDAAPSEASAERSFFGRIAARETVDLSFEVGGLLVEFPVVEGETVEEGALLAHLEYGPFERAVEEAELALAQAERDYERASQLAEQNVASQVQADDTRTARDLSRVALRNAREALSDATLEAPFAALVASRLTAQYSNVQAGLPIVRLHDMSEIRVEIDVPERLFQRATGPDSVRFHGLLPQVEGPIPLELVEFDAQTGSVGQTFLVTLRLPELNIPTLIPGATMTVIASTDIDAGAGIPLPATALLPGADRAARVMIYEPEGETGGTVRAQEVQVTSISGTDLTVSGLPDGAQIVATGGHLLNEGQRVRPYTGLSVEE
ncbi:efflux RND transporter periplasmic adaptor subunit [Aestuariibius insulae]|uniref:efflux RND transporter periplasmic adaptor subunit n=1 Tax=Aestuariibius insulae TaxID=2058287 RepID=UPI00345E402B